MAKQMKDENGNIYKIKKPFYKRVWFIVLAVFVLIGIISKLGGGDNTDNTKSTPNKAVEETQDEANNEEAEEITYKQVDAGQMLQELEDNALKASDEYTDQYVEVTGKIYNIDSSGKYVNIDGINDEFTMTGIMCYLKNDDQKSVVSNAAKGQTVTVKGKVTKVGEVMGYSLDMDEIVAQ